MSSCLTVRVRRGIEQLRQLARVRVGARVGVGARVRYIFVVDEAGWRVRL